MFTHSLVNLAGRDADLRSQSLIDILGNSLVISG